MIISASDLIVNISNNALKNKFYLNPGHNGPYHDKETPLRNYSHWLITLSNIYQWNNNNKYLDVIIELSNKITEPKFRPFGFSFYSRDKKGKDKCNGLIGQAWTFEALVKASEILNDVSYINYAIDVFLKTKFQPKCALWNRLEFDGQSLSIDPTFNHQLWFAACSGFLNKYSPEVNERINNFLNKLEKNCTVVGNGLVFHPLLTKCYDRFDQSVSLPVKICKFILQKTYYQELKIKIIKGKRKFLIDKSIGYQCFNTYAFALLNLQYPDHYFWEKPIFTNIINYLLTDKYISKLKTNKYSYPYNAPGFEIPFSLFHLSGLPEKDLITWSQKFLQNQCDECFDIEKWQFAKNNTDPHTLTSRIYELSRLPFEFLNKIKVQV